MAATEFESLTAFYADRPERKLSGESDYGVHWSERRGQRWPLWRVSYIKATGEVYAYESGDRHRVRILGVVPPDEDRRHETGDWGRGATYYETLDRILDGWAELPPGERTLGWVTARLGVTTRAAGTAAR